MGSTLTVDNIKDSGDNTLVSSTGSGFKMNFAGLNTSSPVAGDMYYNSTFKKLMIYNGSAWVPVDENEGASNGTAGTGGIETTYTSYKIHTFTSTGNFVCTTHGLVDVLLLGGGGGGGFQAGGGGGAGGFLWYSNVYIPAGTYTATVGTAGTGSTADGVKGTSGGDTSINIASLKTAIGGGGAGSLNTDGGLPGGSGGGGSSGYGGFGQGGGCVPEQGFLGGHSNTHPSIGSSNRAGGGGGGAGGAGMHGWEESSGFGGHGVWAFVGDGASTKALLDSASVGTSSDGFKWIAAGGGGGAQADSGSYRKGSGGYGGAGNGGGYSGGGTDNNGGNATANTGSGGGGGGRASGGVGLGGNGAAGLVIIRYAI